MAGTFSVRLVGRLTNELHSESFGATSSKTIAQVGEDSHSPVINVQANVGDVTNWQTSGCTQITSGDISEVGYLYLKNLDTGNPGNPIFIGPRAINAPNDVHPILQLDPTGEMWFKASPDLKTNGLWARAKTGTTKLQVKWFEA